MTIPDTTTDTTETRRSCLVRATDMALPKRRKWIVPGLLPLGCLVFLAGDEGIGKSTFGLHLASVITSGKGDTGLKIPAGNARRVYLYSTEDNWGDTTSPALKAMGCDFENLSLFFDDTDGTSYPSLGANVIKDMHEDSECYGAPALIIVDNFIDTLPANVQQNKPEQLRSVLKQWGKIAKRLNACVLCLHHTNRSGSDNSRDQWAGSSEYRKAARVALMAKDNEDGTFTVGVDKCNLSPERRAVIMKNMSTSTFVLYEGEKKPENIEAHVVEYVGESDRSIAELVEDKADDDTGGDERNDTLRAFLISLSARGGSATRRELCNGLKDEGYSDRKIKQAIKTAKSRHFVDSDRSGFQGETTFALTVAGRDLLQNVHLAAQNGHQNVQNKTAGQPQNVQHVQHVHPHRVTKGNAAAKKSPGTVSQGSDSRALRAWLVDGLSVECSQSVESLYRQLPRSLRDSHSRDSVKEVLDSMIEEGNVVKDSHGRYLKAGETLF